jgi:hypothetical protein
MECKDSECKSYLLELKKANIRNQGLTYFGLALIFAASINPELYTSKPFFGFTSNTWPIPLPYINLGIWPLITIDAFLLGIALFFVVALFIKQWFNMAVKIARITGILLLLILPMTFMGSTMKAVAILLNQHYSWFVIFFWLGMIIFIALEVHIFIELKHIGWKTRKDKNKSIKFVRPS